MKLVIILIGILMFQKIQNFTMGPTLCTGSKTVNSYHEYLTAFRKGPCSPVLFHPGFTGITLQVQADCKKLKEAKDSNEYAKTVLNKCSFMCSWGKKHYENTIWVTHEPIWKYVLWSDFNFLWKRRSCAFYLFTAHKELIQKTKWDTQINTVKVETKYNEVQIPGVQIKVFGDTESTKDISKCGRGAIENIAGDGKQLYGITLDVFESVGYVQGLTFQVNIYDFRFSSTKNGVIERAKFGLNMLTALTGKRSVMFGHSYGNNVVMNVLDSMTQKEKDSLVREFIAIGPPFLGSLQALFFVLGQSGYLYSPFIKEKIGWAWLSKQFDGVNPEYARQVFPYLDGLYEFLSQTYQIEPFYERIQKNKDKLLQTGISQTLYDDLIADLKLATEETIITKKYEDDSGKKEYKLNELDSVLKELSFDPFFYDYFSQFDYESVASYKNPGVATRVIFLSEQETIAKLSLFENPREAFDDYRFPKGETKTSKGDQTVNLFSMLAPPVSWMLDWLEHSGSDLENVKKLDNGEDEDTVSPQKVTFIEFGFGESKHFSENYEYIHCTDDNPFKQLKRTQNQFTEEDVKKSSIFDYIVNKGINAYEFAKSYIENVFSMKDNTTTKSFKYTFSNEENIETCTHSSLVINPMFFGHTIKVLSSPDDVKTDKDIIDTDISDEVYENFIFECPSVRCHFGFENCWREFEETFKFIK
jgi:hypothetical protein